MLQSSFNAPIPLDDIFPYVQPIVSMHNNQIIKFEALARKVPETKGAPALTPSTFLNKIPEEGLAHFDLHMLEQTCNFVQSCTNTHRRSTPPPIVNVNFTPTTLAGKDTSQKITNCLQKYNIRAEQIGIEILEHPFKGKETDILNTLYDLHLKNHPIIVDDLGAGASSITRVKTLKNIFQNENTPLTVKIDMKFSQLLYKLSKSFSSILNEKELKGISIVFEGVSPHSMELIKQEHGNLKHEKPISFQTFDLFEPMPTGQALHLLKV